MIFERVYTVTDFYDGPRSGIADWRGAPHWFDSEWDDMGDEYVSTYALRPLPADDTFALAMEDWAIWLRWDEAFHAGRTALETHPALADDRPRWEALRAILDGRRADAFAAPFGLRMQATFRRVPTEVLGATKPELEVAWVPL